MNNYKTMKIEYPHLFMQKVREVYPQEKDIHKKMEEGESIGSFLNDSSDDFTFHPHFIVANFEHEDVDFEKLPESIQGLYAKAAAELEKQNLFGWFLEISSTVNE